MKIIGTDNKISFIKDILSNITEWQCHVPGKEITIIFRELDNRKVHQAIYKWLKTRKKLGAF